jgi:hypothetical protein
MESVATVRTEKQITVYTLSPLQTAEIVSRAHGFYDLDVDQDDRGVKIVAMSAKKSLTARGATHALAVERLIDMLIGKEG